MRSARRTGVMRPGIRTQNLPVCGHQKQFISVIFVFESLRRLLAMTASSSALWSAQAIGGCRAVAP